MKPEYHEGKQAGENFEKLARGDCGEVRGEGHHAPLMALRRGVASSASAAYGLIQRTPGCLAGNRTKGLILK